MKPVQSGLQTFLKAAFLLALLFTGSRVINSFAEAGEVNDPAPIQNPQPADNLAVVSQEEMVVFGEDEQDSEELLQNLSPSIFQDQLFPDHDICAEAWQVDVDVIPQWLQTPAFAEQLHTEVAYNLLAGRLITSGLVDASECDNGGVLFNGAANGCGLDKALPAVIVWQNQFDDAIFLAAKENRVPAFLLKRLFARETQFWPGTSWIEFEYGLGQATSFGLDALFQYYPSFFQSICPSIFSADTCKKSYASLSQADQALLRGYLASNFFKADCETCAGKINITKVTASIDIFAKMLVANCHQVNQIIFNITEEPGGVYSSYEDLWRFTLVNYNGGSGCVNDSVAELFEDEAPMNWVNFANELIKRGTSCAASIDYTFEISR